MVSCVKSVLPFMVAALFQSILHKEHGFIRGLYLKKNPGKKLGWHGKSKSLKRAILAKANLASEESKASKNPNPAIHLVIYITIIF